MDSQSALKSIERGMLTNANKHYKIDLGILTEVAVDQGFVFEFVPTKLMLADPLTKQKGASELNRFKDLICNFQKWLSEVDNASSIAVQTRAHKKSKKSNSATPKV